MVINFKLEGLDKLKRRLDKTKNKLSDLRPFWNSVGEYMKTRTIKECFDKEQSPDGEAWKPIHREGKILSNTGELKKSIQYQADRKSVIIGSNLKYSRIHQFGGKIKVTPKMRAFLHYQGIHLRKTTDFINIPARPYLGISQADRKHIAQMFKMYFKYHNSGGG